MANNVIFAPRTGPAIPDCQCFSRRFCMSHHFDTKLAREDPSLNLCDFYLFDGPSGKTVMAMTVNPDVGLSAPDTRARASSRGALRVPVRPERRCEGRGYVQVQVW